MKTPEQFLGAVRRRLANSWHVDAACKAVRPNQAPASAEQQTSWPHSFPLGSPPRAALEADFDRHQKDALAWRDWSLEYDVPLTDTSRIVHGTVQPIPTHVTVRSVDVAARLCGPGWVARIERGRTRAAQLRREFPHIGDLARIIRDVDGYSTVDFNLLRDTATWFSRNSAAGLTPRQVPIPGLHAKWLNTHRRTVAVLAGVPSLQLLPPHPARLHFTYLDPDHRLSGGRWHDSATVGDAMVPAYTPEVIVISENKDTALHFPELAAGVSVEGMGYGGSTSAAFDWLRTCPKLFYWGDMDAAGFEILNGFRESGLAVTSVLMDLAAFERYEQFGTETDARGNPVVAGKRRPLQYLTDAERDLYDCLTDQAWTRYRRVEQEKIPLNVAAQVVSSHITQ